MNYTVPGLILLVVIAAVCGAVGRAIAGGVRGGLIVSTALGFIGALIGPWIAARLHAGGALHRQHQRASLPGAVVDHRRRASSSRSCTCSPDGR
ncbi:MAG: hypothetical protein MZW92_53490 [Comamonadaceae bacterium]|nr:hypothetical protein [Comamonadaceae bacterium]